MTYFYICIDIKVIEQIINPILVFAVDFKILKYEIK